MAINIIIRKSFTLYPPDNKRIVRENYELFHFNKTNDIDETDNSLKNNSLKLTHGQLKTTVELLLLNK
jgi:hypothetical protein